MDYLIWTFFFISNIVYFIIIFYRFNKKFIDKEVKKTNSLFGGLNIDEPRIVFVYGSADPLRSVGITTKKNKKNIDVVTVKGLCLLVEGFIYNNW